MDRLEQIKNEVARDRGWAGGFNEMAGQFDCPKWVVDEVARRYATEMVRHNLERAAEQNKDLSVDAYESITSLELELL